MGLTDQLSQFFNYISGNSEKLAKTSQTRVIQEDKAMSILAKYKAEFEKQVDAITDKLVSADINARQWKALVINELRYLMITSAAVGAGGLGMLTQQDLAEVDNAVMKQAGFLDSFASQIERTPPGDLKFGKLKKRTAQYFGAAKPLLEKIIAKSGNRPVLPFNPAQRTDCGNNCWCSWKWTVIDAEKGDYDVYWKLSDVDHCVTCTERAKTCNPLKIRNGQILTDLSNRLLYSSFND